MTKSEMKKKVRGLEKVVVGQTAMIAMLATLLVKKGVLTQLDAKVVVMAGIDAQDFKGLAAEDVSAWALKNLKDQLGA